MVPIAQKSGVVLVYWSRQLRFTVPRWLFYYYGGPDLYYRPKAIRAGVKSELLPIFPLVKGNNNKFIFGENWITIGYTENWLDTLFMFNNACIPYACVTHIYIFAIAGRLLVTFIFSTITISPYTFKNKIKYMLMW